MAHVEPLPLVPATVITRLVKRIAIRSATALTRSSPRSMFLGCNCSHQASHSARVFMATGLSGYPRAGRLLLDKSARRDLHKDTSNVHAAHLPSRPWTPLSCTRPSP